MILHILRLAMAFDFLKTLLTINEDQVCGLREDPSPCDVAVFIHLYHCNAAHNCYVESKDPLGFGIVQYHRR